MNFDELQAHMRKFSTSGEELFKVRELLQLNFDALLAVENGALFGYRQVIELLGYQLE